MEKAVAAIHPTILVGTSTCAGAFTEPIVREMASHCSRPMIFPLSNPTELAEAKASDLIRWTKGRALVATGIPSEPVEYDGVSYAIGQANNALIYPGLGVIASQARLLTDGMISAAAHSLGGIVDPSQPGAAVLPPVSRLMDFSETVAAAVAGEARKEGLAGMEFADPRALVRSAKWTPAY